MDAATSDRLPRREPARLTAGDLEVVFEWAGDRWRHRAVHRGRLVAESVEGCGPGDDPRWPASPVLQEVSAGGTPARPVLLAVGAAGRSHFSASVAVDPVRHDTVIIEAACRIQEPPRWVGSTYRLGAGGMARVEAEATAAPPCTLCWSCRIGPEGVSPAGAAAGEPPSGSA